jgi:hypothetical protein
MSPFSGFGQSVDNLGGANHRMHPAAWISIANRVDQSPTSRLYFCGPSASSTDRSVLRCRFPANMTFKTIATIERGLAIDVDSKSSDSFAWAGDLS